MELLGNSISIVGFSSTREYAPWKDEEGWPELWVCNRLPVVLGEGGTEPFDGFRWTRHFDPHEVSWTKRVFDEKSLWAPYEIFLTSNHGDNKVIYLGNKTDVETGLYPNAELLPYKELTEFYGREYFTSAIAYQIGLAIMLLSKSELPGPKRLSLFGIDLRHDSEYADQKPCVEWLLGQARFLGIDEIIIPETSPVLNMDKHCDLYGIEEETGVYGEILKAFKVRLLSSQTNLADLAKKNQSILDEMHMWDGSVQECNFWIERITQRRRGGVF